MEHNLCELPNKVFSNNKDILLEIINELQEIINTYNDNILAKKLDDIIIKINNMIKDNKKNLDLIINDIAMIQNKNEKSNCDINDKREVNYPDGSKYIGQIINGLKGGKGIFFWKNGLSYEGDWKNDIMEGKGIYYFNNGDRYEGDWKNNEKEGNGIFYYENGDRELGNYLNGKRIGKHVKLTKYGEFKVNNY